MKVNDFFVNITSANPEKLIAFYRDTIGLEMRDDMGPGAFVIGGHTFTIDGHSEVASHAKEPQRTLIDFMVDDLAAEQSRLEAAGVKFIRTAGKEYWGGVISTFEDPDGNYCQLIEFKPENAPAQ
jgi:predicted enzyme related to lactoylglutathione lyase